MTGAAVPRSFAAAAGQQVPRAFQFLLVAYILLTGNLPTVIQALAYGVHDGVVAEFTAAMLTSFVLDLLLIAPVFILARHPLGILHPLIIAVVVWPLLTRMPAEIELLGGWAPVIVGAPVETPFFDGLGAISASGVWTAIAKFDGLEIAALCSTYLGFGLWRGGNLLRRPPAPLNPLGAQAVVLGLIGLSTIALLGFIYVRGGLAEHLSDLGRGRFRSLSGMGVSIVMADLGVVAMLLWLAVRPKDARSPLFILMLAVVVAGQFISNGSRGSAFAVIMVLGLVWALRVQRIPWRIALVLLPVFLVSIGLLNVVRTASWSGLSPGEALSSVGAADAFEKVEQEVRIRTSLSAQVPIVERGFQVSGGPLGGRSYMAAVLAFVPRSMWEDKPRGPGSLYAQMFLGDPREGRSIPVGATAEAYWNFGVFGLVVVFIVYGALLRLIYRFFWRRYPDPFAICLYALFATTFRMSTDELVRFQQQFALLLFSYVVLKLLVPKVRPAPWLSYRPPQSMGNPSPA